MQPEPTDITWHAHRVTRQDRQRLAGRRGCVVWFTGLSGCGKSTIANELEYLLFERGIRSYLLDGDNVRHGLSASGAILAERYDQAAAARFGLGFGPEDRRENIRRIACVAELFCDAAIATLCAFVSPYREDRAAARRLIEEGHGKGSFVEVFVDAPLAVCESRDPKGLYKKARAGELADFTGISAPYEPPPAPEIHLAAGEQPPQALAEQVLAFLEAGPLAPLAE